MDDKCTQSNKPRRECHGDCSKCCEPHSNEYSCAWCGTDCSGECDSTNHDKRYY